MDDELRFRSLYDATWRRVYGYARRHCDPHLAEIVLQDTMLAAWRHLDRLPAEPMGWLITTAKRALASHHRGVSRHDRLIAEIAAVAHLTTGDGDLFRPLCERDAAVQALTRLSAEDREALLPAAVARWGSAP
jgi:RNA polymerase sigma-70 factor (ECF subfamily)